MKVQAIKGITTAGEIRRNPNWLLDSLTEVEVS